MAVVLHFGSLAFAAELVIFDKDGTLIDFNQLWAVKTASAVESLVAALAAHENVRGDLYFTLGYEPAQRRFAEQSPVITAPVTTLDIIAATVLYRHGWGWLDAETLVAQHFAPAMAAAFAPEMLEPTADLPPLFAALARAGVRIGVITSDDRAPTAATLALLGVADAVEFLAAADDPYPHKPAPDAFLAACAQFGIVPAQAVMVGDSTTDLVMAQRAGAGLRVAVLTGVMDEATLAPYADVVLASVAEIRV